MDDIGLLLRGLILCPRHVWSLVETRARGPSTGLTDKGPFPVDVLARPVDDVLVEVVRVVSDGGLFAEVHGVDTYGLVGLPLCVVTPDTSLGYTRSGETTKTPPEMDSSLVALWGGGSWSRRGVDGEGRRKGRHFLH